LSDVKKELIRIFSDKIMKNGEVDKQKLASIIFNDRDSLKKVNDLIHPLVRQGFKNWVKSFENEDYVMIEVAILFENGFNSIVDKVICVSSILEDRIIRTVERDKSSIELVKQRMENQWPQEKIAEKSDFVIFNSNVDLILPQILAIDKALRLKF